MEALSDKRNTIMPVPDNLEDYLNEHQLHTLHKVENFGWHLLFVRRPLFQDVVPVVVSADGTKHGIIEEDGNLNMQHDLLIR